MTDTGGQIDFVIFEETFLCFYVSNLLRYSNFLAVVVMFL